MKTFFLPLFAWAFVTPLYMVLIAVHLMQPASLRAQEFQVYKNGLIYSETTMKQLGDIVDSLNLKFRVCELGEYYAMPQAVGYYVYLDTGDVQQMVKDMDAGISLDAFKVKYPFEEVEEYLVIKYRYSTYDGDDIVTFAGQTMNGSRYDEELEFENQPALFDKPLQNGWVYKLYENDVGAFYFFEDFKKQQLPEEYARIVQYADCMVDTNTTTFFANASSSGGLSLDKENTAVDSVLHYAERITKGKYKYAEIVHPKLANDTTFKALLRTAVDEAVKNGGSTEMLEFYAGTYLSKADELMLKRGRKVMGMCSMDPSPRWHARDIAMLSAETANWEVFLRAHLNIMNDRFDRVSDGSYAWGRRETYISELEELDINVTDLLLGITLRISNPGKYHYYGDVSRTGRALAETQHRDEVEQKILSMIADSRLDDYNRELLYFLFRSYNHYLEDKQHQKENITRLKEAITKLPPYLAERIEIEEE